MVLIRFNENSRFSFIENKHNKLIFVDFNNYMIQLDNILKVDQNETNKWL